MASLPPGGPLRSLDPHPFWDFSLGVYGRPGVADASIALQDDCGADVNMLLLCGWIGAAGGGTLEQDALKELLGRAAEWQAEIVQPLRHVRRRLKSGFREVSPSLSDPLRKQIQALEIESEHVEQLVLGQSFDPASFKQTDPLQRAKDAAANLSAYFAAGGLRRSGAWRRSLISLMAGMFPQLGRQALDEAITHAFGESGDS